MGSASYTFLEISNLFKPEVLIIDTPCVVHSKEDHELLALCVAPPGHMA